MVHRSPTGKFHKYHNHHQKGNQKKKGVLILPTSNFSRRHTFLHVSSFFSAVQSCFVGWLHMLDHEGQNL